MFNNNISSLLSLLNQVVSRQI